VRAHGQTSGAEPGEGVLWTKAVINEYEIMKANEMAKESQLKPVALAGRREGEERGREEELRPRAAWLAAASRREGCRRL